MSEEEVAGFFLSGWYVFDNFAPFQVRWRGVLYPTAEHAYQAAHFFETNPGLAQKVRECGSPQEASDLANANAEYDDPDWHDKRVDIMNEIVRAKLQQHPFVRKKLLESGNRRIVEMNDNDAFWGWGSDHQSRNELGHVWMRLRRELMENGEV